jgi:apoptosis-inducing factor 2
MLSETLDFYSKGSRVMVNLVAQRISQQFYALGHRSTYREVAKPKNVIVLGGSYAGVYLAQRLTETLPTGYRAVLVERNTHFHHLFVFPRFAVVRGHEEKAFIPFHGIAKSAPVGIFQHICDTVTGVQPHQVQLASGSVLDYEYLAIATGSWQPSPAKVVSTTKNEGAAELRDCQDRISRAGRIAVIGGGPVGVQLASDIKSYYPQKDVTLVHSRM